VDWAPRRPPEAKEKASGSFLKKRTKKLLSIGLVATAAVRTPSRAAQGKVFWFFLQKRTASSLFPL
jgi:hypothetical protein